MRERKFRAWDKDNEHMAYSDKHEWEYSFSFDGKIGNLACAVNCCYCDTFGDEHDDWIELDNIMDYTGIKDKHDKEIYEGDIVKCYADTDENGNDLYFFYKVVWHENYHCWWLGDIYTNEDEYLHEYNSEDIEVLGNVYENAELLSKTN